MRLHYLLSLTIATASVVVAAPADVVSDLVERASACTAKATDHLEFDISIQHFEDAREAKNPACDWSSDNCSKSPDNPDGYKFAPYCQRHDFGYRNAKKQHRCSEAYRKRVDDRFKEGLYDYCNGFSGLSSWKGVECRRLADVYYAAVRKYGTC